MTAVLAAVAGVAVACALALAWAWSRQRRAAREAEERASELNERVTQLTGQVEDSEQRRRAAEVRAGAAEGRLRVAEQRAGDAEKRAGDAEKRVAEAMRRADEAARAAAESDETKVVWEMERLRVEREWLDVVGPGVDLPVPWDGSMAAVVAIELSVIREVMGTPSELSVHGPASVPPAVAGAVARTAVEMLRALARSGEEMTVEVGAGALTVTQPVAPGDQPPSLASLATVASAAGLAVSADASDGRVVTALTWLLPRET
jgi:hypothetical protein